MSGGPRACLRCEANMQPVEACHWPRPHACARMCRSGMRAPAPLPPCPSQAPPSPYTAATHFGRSCGVLGALLQPPIATGWSGACTRVERRACPGPRPPLSCRAAGCWCSTFVRRQDARHKGSGAVLGVPYTPIMPGAGMLASAAVAAPVCCCSGRSRVIVTTTGAGAKQLAAVLHAATHSRSSGKCTLHHQRASCSPR